MPRFEDDFTSTVDGASAFEAWHAEPEMDDDRPSLMEALRDDWMFEHGDEPARDFDR